MLKNADMPAMPLECNGFGQYAPEVHTGLTKREMFAMAAMQGMLPHSGYSAYPETIADRAVEYADALLAELEKKDDRK